MLQSIGSQRVGHNLTTEQQQHSYAVRISYSVDKNCKGQYQHYILFRSLGPLSRLIQGGVLGSSRVLVAVNPPNNAGDSVLIPDPGRAHMLQSN